MFTLLYLKQITNRDLMHSTQNSTQYTEITQMGKEFEKEEIHTHTHIKLNHSAVHLKLIHDHSTII